MDDSLIANPAIGAVIIVVLACAIGGLVFNVLSHVLERDRFRASLRELDEIYDLVSLRDQELLVPFADRVGKPLAERFERIGRRFAPGDYVVQVRSKHLRAGDLDLRAPDRFLALKAGATVGGIGVALLVLVSAPMGGMPDLMIAGMAVLLGILGPDAQLNRRVEDRERAVLRQLPDILDLLVICVEAGLGFNSALARTVESVEEGEMAKEFSLALGEMKAGATRSEALQGVADRVRIREVVSFVSALRQADRFGVSISGVLREQAKDIRVARSQVAREKAQKAPVKMLGPMVLFIFPPLFLLILAPAFMNISAGF